MSRTTGSLGRPIQGISQQPAQVRLLGQCEDSVNFRPDVVEGLITRPGTSFGAKLRTTAIPANAKTYEYERGTGESYFFVIESNGTISAWSEDGTEHVVNISSAALSYLTSGGNPKENLELKTISDYTFIINKSVVVAEESTTTPTNPQLAIVYAQFANYEQTQKILIQHPGDTSYTVVSNHKTADGDPNRDYDKLSSGYIANIHYTYLEASIGSGGTNDYTITLDGDCVYILRDDGQEFQIKVEDDNNGENLIVVKDTISETSKLPPNAPEGFVVTIDPPGGSTIGDATYYLKAIKNSGGSVTWTETVAPGISSGLDLDTMPITMVRDSITSGVATFEVELGDWEGRTVGDDRTNPHPSFVGSTLSSIGIIQNRIFVTSGENLITTRTDNFFDFYRETAQQGLDTDSIDIYADSDKINILKTSIPFDGDLVFFSENGQFTITGDKVLTPDNASLRQTTTFESDLSVKPVASGENIFFCYNNGQYLGIREYFNDSITDTKRARPITEHIDNLIKGTPTVMKSSTNLNVLFVKTDNDPTVLYAYDWLWQGSERVQAAWGKIEFDGDEVQDFYFRKSTLYLIIKRPDGVYIEPMDLNGALEGNVPFRVCLDRRKEVTLTYSTIRERWETPDIFPYNDIEDIVGVANLNDDQAGIGVSFYRDGATLCSDDYLGEILSADAYIGIYYSAEYVPTNPVPKDASGNPMELEKFTIARWFVDYITTGDVEYTVTDRFGNSKTTEKGNRTFGFPNNLVGYDELIEGEHVIGIRKKATRFKLHIKTRDFRPLNIRTMQWQGSFNPRGRRLQT